MLEGVPVCAWGCSYCSQPACSLPPPSMHATNNLTAAPLACPPQPFFSLLLSLGGAVTWWPLNVAVPHLCFRAVYRTRGWRSRLMWLVFWGTLAASVAAAVAAVRQIIVGWTDVVFFQ